MPIRQSSTGRSEAKNSLPGTRRVARSSECGARAVASGPSESSSTSDAGDQIPGGRWCRGARLYPAQPVASPLTPSRHSVAISGSRSSGSMRKSSFSLRHWRSRAPMIDWRTDCSLSNQRTIDRGRIGSGSGVGRVRIAGTGWKSMWSIVWGIARSEGGRFRERTRLSTTPMPVRHRGPSLASAQ